MKNPMVFSPLLMLLALSACDRPTVVTNPPPVVTTPPAVVATPVPVPVPGPPGPQGAPGEPGKPGKPGDTVVVVPPSEPAKQQ